VSLTAEELRNLFYYDQENGLLICKNGSKGRRTNDIAGHLERRTRRRRIYVNGRRHFCYRLVWLYVTGEWPEGAIDHINGNQGDDRFENLRIATRSENQANIRRPKHNTSGFKGVSWSESRRKWCAGIKKDGKSFNLGRFDSAEEAHAAYVAKAHELFGEYARAA